MSTDFFRQQEAARRHTGWLVLFFVLAVTSIIAVVYVAIAVLVAAVESGSGPLPGPARVGWDGPGPSPPVWESPYEPGAGRAPRSPTLWRPPLLAAVSLGVLLVILAGSAQRMMRLSSGGQAVALLLGGRLVDPRTTDLAERRLLNVVEEMALASGVPTPPVYVLDRERSINAFAAGHDGSDAVIGVSRGCLAYLTRDELQGVMAHEFSHILNGDMRLDLRLAGAIFGILLLATLGGYLVQLAWQAASLGGRDRAKGGLVMLAVIFGMVMIVVGYVGVFFARLIKAAVSRQREYLADAAAVQFTRNPPGIAGALKKIGGLPQTSRIRDPHAEEVSHMFFGDAHAGSFLNFFATHPPLVQRIRRIEPAFDGRFPRVEPLSEGGLPEPPRLAAEAEHAEQIGRSMSGADGGRRKAAGTGARPPVPDVNQLLYASALVAAMPDAVLEAAREPYSARALIFALLLSRDPQLRQAQSARLQAAVDEPCYRETFELAAQVERWDEGARAPLVDMAQPALRRLSPAQYGVFRNAVEAMIRADGRIDLFEYMVRTTLLRNLDLAFGLAKHVIPRYYAITPLAEPLATVLSTVAHAGQDDPEAARVAFQRGMDQVGRQADLVPRQRCTLSAFDAALGQLGQASPKLKQLVLNACAACVIADGQVTVREGELLRSIAGALGNSLPPMVPAAAP
jgi:Zn-dependent protease with chaperone function